MPDSSRRDFLQSAGPGMLAAGLLLNLSDGAPLLAAEAVGAKKLPNKLFVCLLKTGSPEELKRIAESIGDGQSRYMTDLYKKGIFWAGGPTVGGVSIEIYSVDTVEEAMKAQRNAPLYLRGYLHDEQYLEWHPNHWPTVHPEIDLATGKAIKAPEGK